MVRVNLVTLLLEGHRSRQKREWPVSPAISAGPAGSKLPPFWLGVALLALVGVWLARTNVLSSTEPIEALREQTQMVTRAGAVVCATPFQLRRAIIAAHLGEGGRVLQLGCMRPRMGTRGVLIFKTMMLNGPWEVELIDESGSRTFVWTYAQYVRVLKADVY